MDVVGGGKRPGPSCVGGWLLLCLSMYAAYFMENWPVSMSDNSITKGQRKLLVPRLLIPTTSCQVHVRLRSGIYIERLHHLYHVTPLN